MDGNQNHPISPQFPSSSSNSFETDISSPELRYYGLRKTNYLKLLKKDLSALSNYVFSIAPTFIVYHNIMSVLRIIQFLLPCLLPAYFNFWERGTPDQITINVLAVIFYFIPPTAFFQCLNTLLLVYDIIQILLIIIVISSSFYFKKYAKLPGFVPPFIYFYHSTFGYYFHPIILYSIFAAFSYLTKSDTRSKISIVNFSILASISLLCIIFNFLFMLIATSQTIIFRPNSLASTVSQPRTLIFYATIFVNIFFGIAINLDKIYQIIFLSLNVIIYVISTFSVFTKGGFIQKFISNIILSSSITGAVFTIIDIIFIAIDKKGSLAILFCFLVFFVLMTIVNFFVLQSISMKNLKQLDEIQADKDLFSLIKSPNKFLQLAKCGIQFAHPIILDSSFFISGIDKWAKNPYVYFIYVKFITIYPEETVTLKFIYKSVKMQKISGSIVRCIKEQSKIILRQREIGLSSELRNKLSGIKKQNQSTKHKLGHVWDVVIRGNMNEIEAATKIASSSINEVNTNFKHLLHDYPNNRNVTHYYSTFLDEVMANHQLSKEMYERTRALLPGFAIIEDQAHDFGLKTFPNLPCTLKPYQKEVVLMSSTIDNSPYHDQKDNELDNEQQKDMDQITAIKENIESLIIPSIQGTKIIQIIVFLIFFVIPCICGLIYIEIYINKLQRPLSFIGSLSLLRAYAYQVIGFSLRYVGESFKIFSENKESMNFQPPKYFGSTWDTRKQLEYLLEVTTLALQEFASFRMFEENNYYINKAQELIFQNTVPYNYYKSPTNITTSMISIQAAILDFTIQQKMILTGTELTASILSSGTILNPINNAYPIFMNIRDAMNYMIEYISSNYRNAKRIGKILLISLIIIDVVVFFATLMIELKWIKSNKQETYQCLFSLPKNIISKISEKRDTKKVDNQAEEKNKQDENILKIFNSGGTSENIFSDGVPLISGTIIIVIIVVISIVLFVLLIQSLSVSVRNSAPHLNYFLASYAMILSAVNWLNVILFEFGGYPIPTVDFNYSCGRMEYVFSRSRYYYHLVSAGGPTEQQVPFRGFMDAVNDASPKNCTFDYNDLESKLQLLNDYMKKSIKSNFNSLTEVLSCSPVDMTFVLIEPIVIYSIMPYKKGFMEKIDPDLPAYGTIWLQLISPLYDQFFAPMHEKIIPSIDQDLRKLKKNYVPAIAFLLVFAVLVEVIMYLHILSIENHIRSVLRLLLHCSPSVILSSPKITRILTSDFSAQQNDTIDTNQNFFDTVFTNLPDAIMWANNDMIIQSANQACKLIFGDDELVGKNIRDFFFSRNFSGNIETLFEDVNTTPTIEIAYQTKSVDLVLKAKSMIACGKFVVTCRNVTQSHNYNALILTEKQNSDKLLSTILPPSLVGRVQEGEKNISFSVQSASILFSDIVSFTPWCGSLPAQTVMSTLNILFKRLDSILDTKHTMTKIKCIGDCYMAAGGIFAEINQPAVHAKEVVSFGLLSIKEVLLINDEINQNLKIRVGVNTGGPIVAGVLGIGKPTFEILGPPINRAQQMEQNGIPMMVHISMSVYELICGLNFKFCNRRTIDCKNEKVETYLVEP